MLKKLLLATTGIFLLFAGPASAGPLIGGIGALVGSIGAGGLSLGSLAIGIASMGAQWLLSMMLAPEQKQRGIKTRMETGGDNPPTFIVGEYATAGQLIYANTLDKGSNIPEACLVYVICLSALPITAVSNEVFINNERCTIDEGSSWPGGFMEVDEYVKGGGGGGYCLMKFHLGDQSSADNWLEDKFGNDPDRPWNSNMFLPGCAYAIVQCWYSNRGIWTGLPEFRFVVQGAPLYDPRKDSTVGGSGSHRWDNQNTWEYSRNAKVIEYNIHRGFWWDGKHQWGGKAQAFRLPLDYWFAAMNACDEDVPKRGGGTVKRYRIGAEISFDDKPIDVVNEINKSCSGYTTEFGGTYKTWAAGPGLPIATITDEDFAISADLETSPFQPMQLTYNTCYPTFPAPNQQWEVKDAPRYQDDDAFEEDGEELPLDLPLPFVTESSQVQRIARLAIKDSRRQVTHAGQLPPKAWVYEPFDPLAYVSTMFGYSGDGKTFIVANKDDLPNVMQQVLLREWNPNDEGWLAEYEQETDFAPLIVVKPGDLELDVDVFADEVEGPAGKDRPAIRAEWTWGNGTDGPGEVDVRYLDWRIRRSGTTKIIARGKLEAVEDGEGIVSSNVLRWGKDYEIQFRAVPFGIRPSGWIDWQAVSMTAVEVPTGLVLTQIRKEGADGKNDFFVIANWDDTDQDNNGYGVKITIDGDAEYKKTDGSRYKFPVKAPETVTVEVRTRGTEGTPGAYCDPEVINVTKKATLPTTATELTIAGRHRRAVVFTEDHPDADFRRWNFHYSTTNDFTTATKTKHSRSNRFPVDDLDNGQTYYGWITAEDASGNESAKYPASSTAGVAFMPTRLVDDDLDGTAPGTPSVPSISTGTADWDDDGKQEAILTFAWSAGSGDTPKGYTLEIHRATSLGGSYSLWREFEIDGDRTSKSVAPNTRYFYKARVKARGGARFGSSSFSSLTTTGVQPTKRAYSLDPGGNLAIVFDAERKKHIIRIVTNTGAPSDLVDDNQFSHFVVTDRSSGTVIYKGRGTRFTRSNPPATIGYRVVPYDIFGRAGTGVNSPASASGGSSGVGDVETVEISTNAVTGPVVDAYTGSSSSSNTIQSVSGVATTNVYVTLLLGSFRNNTGAVLDVPITLGSKGMGTVRLPDGGSWTGFSWENPSSSYTMTQTGGNDLNIRQLSAIPFRR